MPGEVGVDLDRDAAGDSVVDRSQGADHVAVAGELERGSHVHGFIYLARAGFGGGECGKVREAGVKELRLGHATDGQGFLGNILQYRADAPGIAAAVEAVAHKVATVCSASSLMTLS